MRQARKKRNRVLQQLEDGYVNHWPVNAKQKVYDALDDEHSSYYFILPSVKEHMKKLKKAVKRQYSSQADKLARSIDRKLKGKEFRQSKELPQKLRDKNCLLASNFVQSQHRTEHLRYGKRKLESSMTQQSVTKNRTEDKFPILSKSRNENNYSSTERVSQMERKGKNANSESKQPLVEHIKFQKFLEEKKQQILRKTIAVEGGSAQT